MGVVNHAPQARNIMIRGEQPVAALMDDGTVCTTGFNNGLGL